jgi:hypothetical protein
MREKHERRKRTAKCPKCGELFSPQGLNGHLRFTHGLGGDEMKQQQEAAVIVAGVTERARRTAELVRQLRDLQAQRLELSKPDERDENDDAYRDCASALDAAVLEVRNEIRKLQDKPPLVAVQRRSLGEQVFGGSHTELVEQGPDGELSD